MEAEPRIGSWTIRMTPAERRRMSRKIIAGGKIADKIRRMATKDHDAHEVPAAEDTMDRGLLGVDATERSSVSEKPTVGVKADTPKSFWQKLLHTIRQVFLP